MDGMAGILFELVVQSCDPPLVRSRKSGIFLRHKRCICFTKVIVLLLKSAWPNCIFFCVLSKPASKIDETHGRQLMVMNTLIGLSKPPTI
jgi:hypothetical protein